MNRWKNMAANKRVGWLQQKAKTGQASRKKDGCKSERKRGLKMGKKGAEKVPKRDEISVKEGSQLRGKLAAKF